MSNTHISGLLATNGGNQDLSGVAVQDTDGTTAVDVFTNGAPGDFDIVGIFVISLDTTAGNILVTNAGNTVATIAKGTSAGTLVGATSLSNTSVTEGAAVQVDSSSTGNATVVILYQAS